jgi:hypothetical protein
MKIKEMKNWVVEQQDIETGHLFYIPHGQTNPVVLSGYGKFYAVTGFWVNPPNKILWLELWRTNKAGVVVEATLTPGELMEMECGLCDEKELNIILGQIVVSEYFSAYPVTDQEKNWLEARFPKRRS